jgi:hypothetical protein
MSLKQEFRAALYSDESHHALLELVRRHQMRGLTLQESYEVLEQIWQEFGFDKEQAGGDGRENLEYVMEKVWFQSAK